MNTGALGLRPAGVGGADGVHRARRSPCVLRRTPPPPLPIPPEPGPSEVIVTAQKREENLQHVAMSIAGPRHQDSLPELNITNFQDYVKFLPSVQFQASGPNQSIVYMRGVSDGGDGNHSGPLPSVGTYLDEQPITTIGGTLDVHIYDIARVEVLPGPQGTLLWRQLRVRHPADHHQQALDLRLQRRLRYAGQHRRSWRPGLCRRGFVNVPLASNAAIRIVAFDEHDAGFIDNVPWHAAFRYLGATVEQRGLRQGQLQPCRHLRRPRWP